MTKKQIDALVDKYKDDFNPKSYLNNFGDTQYDDRSASINYAMIRERKPRTVVEFGSRKGRCTRDIYQALTDNGQYFVFKPYEIDGDARAAAQHGLDGEFPGNGITIGGSILEEKIPHGIDYLFVDHSHDEFMNKWVLDVLIPWHCAEGCIVTIHDLPLSGDWEIKDNPWQEAQLIKDRHLAGTLPLKKIYWTYEEGNQWESTWWKYQKLQS